MTTVEVVCYKYTPLKNNELPLKIRVCKDGKTRYVSLGLSIKEEHWDFSKNQPKSSCPNREQLEKLIANKIGEVKAQIVELKADRKEFTATSLVQKINNRDKSVSVRELFQEHLKYLAEMKRMIYNLAIEKGVVKKEYYPFSSYKVSKLHKATAKRAISKEAIRAVIHYPVKGKDFYTRLAVSLFSFSYFMGGINFVDMAYLNSKNIVGDRLIYTRRKTGKLINLLLSSEALSALEVWKHTGSSYLFPILSSVHKTEQMRLNRLHKVITKVNNALKQLGEELHLPVKLTTYVARHSFATVLKREGVSTSIICESLGHSSEKVTQIYLDSFENTQIDEAMKHLL